MTDTRSGVESFGIPLELWLSAFVVVFIPASLQTPWGIAGKYLFLLLSILGLIGFIRLRPSLGELRQTFPIFLVVLIIAATLIGLMRDKSYAAYLRSTPLQLISFVLLLSCTRIWTMRGGNRARWVRLILSLSMLVSSVAVVEYLTRSYVEIDRLYEAATGLQFDDSAFRGGPETFRAISSFGNPLMLGTFAAVCCSAALGLYLASGCLSFLFLFFLNALAVFTSLSRGAWIATALTILFGISFHILRRQGILRVHLYHLIIAASAVSLLLMIPQTQEHIERAFQEVSYSVGERFVGMRASLSYEHRAKSVLDALQNMAHHPETILLGFGLGGENRFFRAPVTGVILLDVFFVRTFDNTYVTLVYCFGLLGLGWFILQILRRVRDNLGLQHLCYLCMIISISVSILFYNAFGSPLVSYMLASILGFGTPLPAIQDKVDHKGLMRPAISDVAYDKPN